MEFVKLTALHIADSINLKKFKSEYTGSLINSSSSELYYRVEENQYLFLLNYGVVVFSNFSDIDMTRTIALIADYSQGVFENKIREDYQIALNEGKKNEFGYQTLLVSEITENLIKVVSINLAESVALDFYFQVSETILNEVKYFTEEMEKKGKVKISKHNMLKFIGKTLNTKNRIIENLYIFDVPEMVWEEPELEKLNTGLIKLFDLRVRYKEIEYTFKIIEDSLTVFRELNLHKESNRLEWIIIVLILIEVFDLILSKFLKLF